MNKYNLDKSRKEWYAHNLPTGRLLGYPECCIRAFGYDSPESMASAPPTTAHLKRYNAGCINGVFTGFIPCIHCAEAVLSGKKQLHELINNRNPQLPPFPGV